MQESLSQNVRTFKTSAVSKKREDKRQMMASMPKPDEGTPGEKSYEISLDYDENDIFPDENLPNRLFGGIRFADLPICHIKSTPNNTILTLTEANGTKIVTRSCGMEGFKNARKGTNVAAQATAINFALRATERGYGNLRVKVQGLGPGRMSSIKGLTMGGVNVVSITDATPVSWNSKPRPRKQRKL
nr:EOG090X0DZ9 [Eulimnadia texana]